MSDVHVLASSPQLGPTALVRQQKTGPHLSWPITCWGSFAWLIVASALQAHLSGVETVRPGCAQSI